MASTETCTYVGEVGVGVKPIEAGDSLAPPTTFDHKFQEIYGKHYGWVLRVAYRMLRSWEMAEELTQEAFIKLYTRFDDITADKPLSGWLYRVVTNLCLDELRRQKIYKIELCADFDIGEIYQGFLHCTSASPEKIINRQEEQKLINEVLARMLPHYCQV
ncbi:MAG TPA: sigma-70 family RNA polymerase sigma factor, partial [Anaerolineae bacterium]|nr:sigma-70 family RNA polymerase sigma factor [Anaerolineae bacterium]